MSQVHPSVLVVDDDPDTRFQLVRRLGVEGVAVHSVPDPRTALITLQYGRRPAMIVYGRSRAASWSFLDALRLDRGLARIPLVVFGGDDALACLPREVRSFRKPSGLVALVNAVMAACR